MSLMQLLDYSESARTCSVLGAQAAKEKKAQQKNSVDMGPYHCRSGPSGLRLPRATNKIHARTLLEVGSRCSMHSTPLEQWQRAHSAATHGDVGSAREESRAAGGTAQKPRKGEGLVWRRQRRIVTRLEAKAEERENMKEIAHQPCAINLLFLTNTNKSLHHTSHLITL